MRPTTNRAGNPLAAIDNGINTSVRYPALSADNHVARKQTIRPALVSLGVTANPFPAVPATAVPIPAESREGARSIRREASTVRDSGGDTLARSQRRALLGLRRDADPATLQRVVEAVADACFLTVKQIRGRDRTEHVAVPRMLCYHLQREATHATFDRIAEWWNLHAGTIAHGDREIRARIAGLPGCRSFVTVMRRRLGLDQIAP